MMFFQWTTKKPLGADLSLYSTRVAQIPPDGLLPCAVFKRIFFPCKEVKEEEDGHKDDAVSGHHKATGPPLNLQTREDNREGFQVDTKTYLSRQVDNYKKNDVNGSMLVIII